MTTVVSRLYADSSTADQVVAAMHAAGHPGANISVISPGDGAVDQMIAARVPAASAAKYAAALSGDGRVVVNRVPFMPFGAARNAMEIADAHGPMHVDIHNENPLVQEGMDVYYASKVYIGGRRFLSSDMDPGRRRRGLISEAFRMPLLSAKRNRNSAISGGRKMFPGKALSAKKERRSAISGGRLWTARMGMPMLSHRNSAR